MTKEQLKKALEILDINFIYDKERIFKFLRNEGLVDYQECTYYNYFFQNGDYAGNDNDDYDVLEELLEDLDYKDFLEAFEEEYPCLELCIE